MVIELDAKDFSADTTLASGQTFRVRKEEDGVWRGMIGRNWIEACEDNGKVRWSWQGDASREDWERYLDLDRDYEHLFQSPDSVLSEALEYGRGLRILRQDPFEVLISFIVSSNNNIKRIGKILDAIARACGAKLEKGYAFPTPQQLASLTELDFRDLGAGYRASFLTQSTQRVLSTDFEALNRLSYEDLYAQLLQFAGIGPKVADCVALFGFTKTQAFPVDVWVTRAMRQLYGIEGSRIEIRRQAAERFGPNAGIAQQFLFHYARNSLAPGS